MQLELNRAEAEMLRKAIDIYSREYDRMLVRTDNPDLQHAMQAESDVLASIRRRVDGLVDNWGQDAFV